MNRLLINFHESIIGNCHAVFFFKNYPGLFPPTFPFVGIFQGIVHFLDQIIRMSGQNNKPVLPSSTNCPGAPNLLPITGVAVV